MMSFFHGSTEFPDPEEKSLPEEEEIILEKLAKQVVKRGMSVPAIIFLESIKPLNFIGSQMLVFFEPIVQSLFNFKDYNTFRIALEKRETVEILIQKIEARDAISHEREKRVRKWLKQEKKKWKWYQRYLGVFLPRYEIPADVLTPPKPAVSDSSNGTTEPK